MQQNDTNDSLLEDIFEEPAFLEQYKKPIKRARITLFVLAGGQLIIPSIYLARGFTIAQLFYTLLISAAFGVIYLFLALWIKKKTYTAIVSAIIVYTLPYLYSCIVYSADWKDSLIIRILIYILLIKALKGAQQTQIWLDNVPR